MDRITTPAGKSLPSPSPSPLSISQRSTRPEPRGQEEPFDKLIQSLMEVVTLSTPAKDVNGGPAMKRLRVQSDKNDPLLRPNFWPPTSTSPSTAMAKCPDKPCKFDQKRRQMRFKSKSAVRSFS